VLVARPLAVLVALAPTRLGLRAQAMVSWVGLRGAVPIILATFPLAAGVREAETIFDAVFFIVLTSVLVQGTTIPLTARWLDVDAPLAARPPYPLEAVSSADGGTSLHEITIPTESPVADRQLVDIGLPAGALVVLISRDGRFVVPQGATVLRSGDNALVLADPDNLARVRDILEGTSQEGQQQ
ncbi:MAG: TrkA C-terminal domain-containing protein, partial [Actinomycetota bacterium]